MDSLLKLVAIATVADVVPLTGENRVIVKRGLAGLDRVANPGLRAPLDVAGSRRGRRRAPAKAAFRDRAAHQCRGTHGECQRHLSTRSPLLTMWRGLAPEFAAQLELSCNKNRR